MPCPSDEPVSALALGRRESSRVDQAARGRMRRAAIAACAVAAIADAAPVPASPHQLLAAEDAAAAAAAASGRPHGKKRERTTVLLEATFQERSRDALLFVPEGLAPGSLVPVIFNYHGFTGSSESQQRNTMMDPVCERRGCAVVYPNGWGIAGSGVLRSHNGGSCCSPANLLDDPSDDVGL
jgi:poly(3-hydroxybutyrate) depolymerase